MTEISDKLDRLIVLSEEISENTRHYEPARVLRGNVPAYNIYMKNALPEYKALNPRVSHRDALKAVTEAWSKQKAAAGGRKKKKRRTKKKRRRTKKKKRRTSKKR